MSDNMSKSNDQENDIVVSRQERRRQIEEEKQRKRDRVRNTNWVTLGAFGCMTGEPVKFCAAEKHPK